jgi:hypothetical protein
MQPEISRRCLSCGAAVRAGARFCPQCGELMDAGAPAAAGQETAAPETREDETPHAGEPTRETESPSEWMPPTKEYAAFAQSFESAPQGLQAGEAAAVETPPRAESPVPPADDMPRRPDDVPRRADDNSSFGAPPSLESPQSYVAAAADGDAGVEASAGDVRGRVARVREGTRARVEKMRDEAIVVLEETPDDSGLRFVLAAAALFVIFLLLLFLSTTVLR